MKNSERRTGHNENRHYAWKNTGKENLESKKFLENNKNPKIFFMNNLSNFSEKKID